MNINLISIVNWAVSNPELSTSLIIGIAGIPKLIQKIKAAKGKNYLDKAFAVASEETKKLISANMENEEKKQRVLSSIYNALPNDAKKHLPESLAIQIVNGVYHTYKNELLSNQDKT